MMTDVSADLAMHGLRIHMTGDTGRIVVATKSFEPGDVVLQDEPLITWDNNSMEDYIRNFFEADAGTKAKILDMVQPGAESDVRYTGLRETAEAIATRLQGSFQECSAELAYNLLQIKRTNAHSFSSPEYPNRGALFFWASKSNHSCRPNVIYSSRTDKMQFTAVQPVDVDEPIYPSYLTDLLVIPYKQRQLKLLETKDFLCACARCREFDDCRGIRCLTSSTTRANTTKTNICHGVAYRVNITTDSGNGGGDDGLWVCKACGAESSDVAMAIALDAERDLEVRFDELDRKFLAATDSMVPDEFTDLIKAVGRVGFCKSHYLAIKATRLYSKWCAGQSESLICGGVEPDAQFVSPWESVCSPVSFLITAIEEGLTIIRMLECVGVTCSDGRCSSTDHPANQGCIMDVFLCIKYCMQLVQYARNKQIKDRTQKKQKGSQHRSESDIQIPVGIALATSALAKKYLPLLFSQFGTEDEDIRSIRDNFLAVSGCSNPSCYKINTVGLSVALPTLMKCSRCQSAVYCSRECQVYHFKNGHKSVCKHSTKLT